MKKTDVQISDIANAIADQSLQLEEILQILKLLMVDGILDELEAALGYEDSFDCGAVSDYLGKYGLQIGRIEQISGKNLLDIIVPDGTNITTKNIEAVAAHVSSVTVNTIAFFQFEKVTIRQKHNLIEKQISFRVKGSDVHVFIS